MKNRSYLKAVRAEGSGASEINDDEDYSEEDYEDEEGTETDNGNQYISNKHLLV